MSTTASGLSREQTSAWIAPARLSPFLEVAKGDHRFAVALYVWHARLSSACNEVIHHVEVLVRDAIHHRLRAGQPEAGLHSWLVDPEVLRPPELAAVANVITRIRRRGRPVTGRRRLHQAFGHGSGLRRDVAGQLNRMAHLRNDIAHHKSLLGVPVEDRHRDLLDLAAAVDHAAAAWIGALSRVGETLATSPVDST